MNVGFVILGGTIEISNQNFQLFLGFEGILQIEIRKGLFHSDDEYNWALPGTGNWRGTPVVWKFMFSLFCHFPFSRSHFRV